MRALGGAITSPCSNDSESRRPTPTIFGLPPHLLDVRWMLLDSPIQITALSGRLLIVFCVHNWLVQLPLQHCIICMLYSFVSADRRATARTTTSLSHAAIRQKKDLLALRSVGCPAPPSGCLRDHFSLILSPSAATPPGKKKERSTGLFTNSEAWTQATWLKLPFWFKQSLVNVQVDWTLLSLSIGSVW